MFLTHNLSLGTGTAVSTSDDGTVCVWDTSSWTLKATVEDPSKEAVSHLAYMPSPTGGILICTLDSSVHVFDPSVNGWSEPVRRLPISVIVGDEVEGGDEERRLQGGVVCSLASRDGMFVTGNYAGKLSKWC